MLGSNNPFPSVLLVEQSGSPETPSGTIAAGQQRVFVRQSDGHLCRIESDNTVTDIEEAVGGGSPSGGSGVIVQVVNTQTGTTATGTTTIPFDNTIPQNTEGDQYMTLAVTPTDTANKLRIEVVFVCDYSTPAHVALALFQDSTANALAATVQYIGDATGTLTICLSHYMTAGTTSATTFKVRAGGHTAGTLRFNGSSAAQLFGGVLASGITITEIVP